jgi:hypothetical protein
MTTNINKTSVIRINNNDVAIYKDTNVYELIKYDLENTKLFSHEDITLSFLNINNYQDNNVIQIEHNESIQTFIVRYVKEVKIKTNKFLLLLSRKNEIKIWEEINYRVFENKKLN